MTPEQADIAFVLETVPGVLGVYAIEPSALRGEEAEAAVVVHYEDDQRTLAAVHYALLRIRRHEDCSRVIFTRLGSTAMHERSSRMTLTGPERFAAMSRVSARAQALADARARSAAAEERERRAAQLDATREENAINVLIVGEDDALAGAAKQAFPDANVVVAWPVRKAVELARAKSFDLVLCPAATAFGLFGFVERLAEYRPRLARDVVVVVAQPGERLLLVSNLESTRRDNRCLLKPVTAESIGLALRGPASVRDPRTRGAVAGPVMMSTIAELLSSMSAPLSRDRPPPDR